MYQARFNENPYYIGSQGDNDSSIDDKTIADGLEENYRLSLSTCCRGAMLLNMVLLGAFQPIKM